MASGINAINDVTDTDVNDGLLLLRSTNISSDHEIGRLVISSGGHVVQASTHIWAQKRRYSDVPHWRPYIVLASTHI